MADKILINDKEYYTNYIVKLFIAHLRKTQGYYMVIPYKNYNEIIESYIENFSINTIKINSTFYINTKGIVNLVENKIANHFKIRYEYLNKRYKNFNEYIEECFINFRNGIKF